MTFDARKSCADMVLASTVQDLSESTGRSIDDVRNDIINSPAYAALYDMDTGLWGSGPDYFAAFYQKCLEGKEAAKPPAPEGKGQTEQSEE